MVTKRVYIVDDHPVVRRGLRQLFEREQGFSVCGEAESVAQALMSVPASDPELVISDLSLGGRNGLELTRQLATHHPRVPVLIVSMHDEKMYAQRAIAAGAKGYVMKKHSEQEVVKAAREVLAGKIYLSDAIRPLVEENGDQNRDTSGSPINALTDRELEVFRLIGEGFPPRHIAENLNLSVSTIEVYRERIKHKMGLKSSPLLLRYAVSWCKDNDAA